MSENPPISKEDNSEGVTDERTVPPSKTGENQHRHRSKRKIFKAPAPHNHTSPRSPASPPGSSEHRGRSRDRHQSFRSKKRNRRRSRSSSSLEYHRRPDSRSPSPKAKEHSRGFKGGLVALGGLLAAGLPIAGELYLKHMVHEHEREKDERKEIRHEQAMEEKERVRMDLELEALEEETGWMSRKHEIDLKRREVDLQIREMELDSLLGKRRAKSRKNTWEKGQDPTLRADAVSFGRPSRMWITAEDMQPLSYRPSNESCALLQTMPRSRDGSPDLAVPDFKKRRKHNDAYFGPDPLRPNVPPEGRFRPLPPIPSHRARSSSPDSRTRPRSPSPPPTRLRAFPTTTALIAGSLTAYRLRDEDGPWLGKKAVRIATSAGTAALTSLTLNGGETPRGQDDGFLEQVVDSRPFAVAAPVMAGIGAERVIWRDKR